MKNSIEQLQGFKSEVEQSGIIFSEIQTAHDGNPSAKHYYCFISLLDLSHNQLDIITKVSHKHNLTAKLNRFWIDKVSSTIIEVL